jgi:hypothetical protein
MSRNRQFEERRTPRYSRNVGQFYMCRNVLQVWKQDSECAVEGAGFGAVTLPPPIGEPESRTEMTGPNDGRGELCGTPQSHGPPRQEDDREAKAYALKCFACLVEEGLAQWPRREIV